MTPQTARTNQVSSEATGKYVGKINHVLNVLKVDNYVSQYEWEGMSPGGVLSLVEGGTDPAPDTWLWSWRWGGACTRHSMLVGGVR